MDKTNLDNVRIKVIYNIPIGIDMELDSKIRYAIQRLGAEWYAQGINCETGDRDICFDLKYYPMNSVRKAMTKYMNEDLEKHKIGEIQFK